MINSHKGNFESSHTLSHTQRMPTQGNKDMLAYLDEPQNVIGRDGGLF